jgi:hypothetical protein
MEVAKLHAEMTKDKELAMDKVTKDLAALTASMKQLEIKQKASIADSVAQMNDTLFEIEDAKLGSTLKYSKIEMRMRRAEWRATQALLMVAEMAKVLADTKRKESAEEEEERKLTLNLLKLNAAQSACVSKGWALRHMPVVTAKKKGDDFQVVDLDEPDDEVLMHLVDESDVSLPNWVVHPVPSLHTEE